MSIDKQTEQKKQRLSGSASNSNVDDNGHEQVSIFDICIFYTHWSKCDLYVYICVGTHTDTRTRRDVGKMMAGADHLF